MATMTIRTETSTMGQRRLPPDSSSSSKESSSSSTRGRSIGCSSMALPVSIFPWSTNRSDESLVSKFGSALGEDRVHALGRGEELRYQLLSELLQIRPADGRRDVDRGHRATGGVAYR